MRAKASGPVIPTPVSSRRNPRSAPCTEASTFRSLQRPGTFPTKLLGFRHLYKSLLNKLRRSRHSICVDFDARK